MNEREGLFSPFERVLVRLGTSGIVEFIASTSDNASTRERIAVGIFAAGSAISGILCIPEALEYRDKADHEATRLNSPDIC